jgi:hypothetical protein
MAYTRARGAGRATRVANRRPGRLVSWNTTEDHLDRLLADVAP